ncbi:hypothetical protein H0H93_010236 [Arthromyces matolae]|nr:hypothetical protein H0H93_010236 [Arthromyces matolae]
MPELPVKSAADLQTRFELLRPILVQPETEDSWDLISNNLKALTGLCENGACEFSTVLITIIRSISRPITNSLTSERTRLSSVAFELIRSLANGLAKIFKPLLQVFLPTLLSLCGRANKVISTRAKACIVIIIEATQISLILSYLVQSIEDKSASVRLTAAEGALACVNCFNPPDLEKDVRAKEVEIIIRTAARDPQADIRVVGRKLFEAYKLLLPHRIESFIGPLSPTTKKYLDLKSARVDTSSMALPQTKKQLCPSTSATSSSYGSIQASHTRGAPSGDRKERSTASTSRQKTDMPPPAFVPVRPFTKPVSSMDARTQVVNLPPRLGAETSTTSQQPPRLPTRPKSVTGQYVPQRVSPQIVVPKNPSADSGPRRVPISATIPKLEETDAKLRAGIERPRVASNPIRTAQTQVKAPHGLKTKTLSQVLDNRPLMLPRPLSTTDKVHPLKTGRVMQPTLSQISRAKATAEQSSNSRVSATRSTSKASRGLTVGKEQTTGTGRKHIEPTSVPLPPSPKQSETPITREESSAVEAAEENIIPPQQPEVISLPNIVHQDNPCILDNEKQTNLGQRREMHATIVEGEERQLPNPVTPAMTSRNDLFDNTAKTPISSLLASIQQGFLMTPSSPLSPPQSYMASNPEVQRLMPIDGLSNVDNEERKSGTRTFMFGIGGEFGRSTLRSVENLQNIS